MIGEASEAGRVDGVREAGKSSFDVAAAVAAVLDAGDTRMVVLGSAEDTGSRTFLVAFALGAGRTCDHVGHGLARKLLMQENLIEGYDIRVAGTDAAFVQQPSGQAPLEI